MLVVSPRPWQPLWLTFGWGLATAGSWDLQVTGRHHLLSPHGFPEKVRVDAGGQHCQQEHLTDEPPTIKQASPNPGHSATDGSQPMALGARGGRLAWTSSPPPPGAALLVWCRVKPRLFSLIPGAESNGAFFGLDVEHVCFLQSTNSSWMLWSLCDLGGKKT